jgi:hypothetical protein
MSAAIATPPNLILANGEELVPLAEATRLFPRRRNRHPHISCLYRWAGPGSKGVVLETAQAPSGLCTSRAAVGRFLSALTVASRLSAPSSADSLAIEAVRTHERARAELGIV